MTETIPLGLYVHLPWCIRKCPYCDFNSRELKGPLPARAYTTALLSDLRRGLAEAEGRTVRTVFFGGGTPSLFPAGCIADILGCLRQAGMLAADAEVTLEANPGTREHVRFDQLLEAGVNRLSLGAQSFDDRQLKALGRVHAAGDIALALREAREAGFGNINLDLMFGLPGQDVQGAAADLEAALALEPDHLSWYQLTIEPNTAFHARPPVLPDPDLAWDMQCAGQALLAGAGMTQYEVSAWSLPGRRCAHNLNYWDFGDYLGVGAGAHEKLTLAGAVERRARWRNPQRYMQEACRGTGVAERHRPGPADLVFEFMLNALRLREGFSLASFSWRTGLPAVSLLPQLRAAQARGLLEDAGERWRPSELGFRFLNDLQAMFLEVGDRGPGGP